MAMANLRRAMERVVVADDNPAMTSVLSLALRMWGFDVVVAHDGVAAIESIRKEHPAVALIDIGLPGLTGLEVARVVRATGAGPLLMVALSGYGEEQDRLRSREAGFDRHLVKPVDPEVLRQIVVSARDAKRTTATPGLAL
jgi:CheY-like chemotaxis protein